jgi:two-component system, NarL family, response regulator NreC
MSVESIGKQQLHRALRVVLADPHAILRDGLRAILKEDNIEIVGEASDGLQAVKMCAQLSPDVALLEISMPLLNGIDAAREIRKISPSTNVVILTMHAEDRYVLAALRAGVSGYVVKTKAAAFNLIQAIDAASKGEAYLSPCISRTVVGAYLTSEASVDPLSSREREVLQLIAEGKNVKEIGDLLRISAKTAESHRANIMEGLGIHDVPGLVRYAIREGLIAVA